MRAEELPAVLLRHVAVRHELRVRLATQVYRVYRFRRVAGLQARVWGTAAKQRRLTRQQHASSGKEFPTSN